MFNLKTETFKKFTFFIDFFIITTTNHGNILFVEMVYYTNMNGLNQHFSQI